MKQKATLIINGNLLTNSKLSGGGICKINSLLQVEDVYDLSEAIVMNGDVHLDSLKSENHIILVTGYLATKGGSYG